MRMLAIECATEACSLALFEDGEMMDFRHEVLGRGHAEHLVPLIAALPGKGRADEIRVSLGPGSFTGIRVGLAAARALGVAWQARVSGYPTLALVAHCVPLPDPRPVTVCMAGGHGEWFVQNFDEGRVPAGEVRSLQPGDAVQTAQPTIAGNRARELAALAGPGRVAIDLLPDARFAGLLSEALLTERLVPSYGRGPDARLPA